MEDRDLNLYKIFLTLYEEKSISKTANKLYVSQPAISYNLKELESQLGYSLFYRNSKGIEPTMEAKELYSYIATAFNIIRTGEKHINSLDNLNTGLIKIGVPSHIAVFYLSEFISEFRKQYPGIRFEIISRSTDDLVGLLETRKIDLIVDTLPIKIEHKSAKKIILSKLQNCFAYSKNKLENCKIEKPEDLLKYPLVLPSEKASMRIRLDEYMEQKNIVLKPVVDSWTTEFMLEMVRRGVGVGYFIKNVIETQKDKDNFEVITFDDSLPSSNVCALYLDDFEMPVLNKFVEFLASKKDKEDGK